MAMDAFDLAERFQKLVFVMSDLDLGMNTWMSHPFAYPEKALDRGKVLDAETLKTLGAEWGRYSDVDGDGIPYRTMPGTGMPSYFTRGSGHNERGQYSERPDDYQQQHRSAGAQARDREDATCRSRSSRTRDSEIGIIGYGTSHWAIEESRAQLETEAGIKTAYMRLRAYPVHGRGRGVHRALPARLSRRAEPRRADADADAHRAARRRDQSRAQRAALQRAADRRAVADRRHPRAGRDARRPTRSTRRQPRRRRPSTE